MQVGKGSWRLMMATIRTTTETNYKSWLEKYPKIFYDEPEPEDRL